MTEQARYKDIDLKFYMEEVSALLPETILDFHTHTWSSANWKVKPWDSDSGKYMVTTDEYPIESLIADGRRVFPDKEYQAVVFGYPVPVVDREKDAAFVAAAGRRTGMYPLMLAGRDFSLSRETIERELIAGSFLGYKVFLNWIGDDYGNRTIEEMLGPTEMALADDLALVVMLHVPRSGRLADPEIQAGVISLARSYPNAQIVLAHCGRCYLPSEMKRAVGCLRDLDNVHMDTSMVMDPLVLQIAMETIGSARLLYATDFPVAAMRGRRVRVMDHWVDVVLDGYPESAFRVASDGIHATFMATEIVLAIRDASERVGLSTAEFQAMFYENGRKLLDRVMDGSQAKKVRGAWQG